jgi:hypothetical protein
MDEGDFKNGGFKKDRSLPDIRCHHDLLALSGVYGG